MSTFIQLCVEGKAKSKDIHDYIDKWHSGIEEQTILLHEFLGLNLDEYKEFVKDENKIGEIVHYHIEQSLRRTGRTTRIIDATIQELFKNKQVFVRDHYITFDTGVSHNNFRRICRIIINRLYDEHNIKTGIKEGRNVDLLYNPQQYSFQLIK